MSKWFAVDAIDEAIDRTKKLLLPFNLSFWLKLALVAMLVGGSGFGNIGNWGDFKGEKDAGDSKLPQLSQGVIILGIAIVAVVIIVGLVLSYLSAISSFVLIKALVKRDLRLVEDYQANADLGVRYFLFNLCALILMFALGMGAFMAGLGIYLVVKSTFILIFLFVLGIVYLAAVIFTFSTIMWLVREFAVPMVYANGGGITDALRQVISLFKSNFWQFSVYMLLKFALGIAAGIVVLVVSIPIIILLAVAAVVLGVAALAGTGALEGIAMTPALIALIVMGIIIVIFILMAVSYVIEFLTLPVSVFLRYYGLLFLQKVNPKLNLLNGGGTGDAEVQVKTKNVKVY